LGLTTPMHNYLDEHYLEQQVVRLCRLWFWVRVRVWVRVVALGWGKGWCWC